MSRYIPMPAYYDDMPVDISFVFENEKPAGKHGFLRVDGEDFRFEDGTLGRFWGVNINGGANFPDHDYAEKFARRLAMTGCNMVRFHQLEAEWDTPNLYSFSKGKRVTSTEHFDPTSLDRLDYLIYCLKNQGIYVMLDMLSYAHYKEEDDVVDYEILADLAVPWCITNPRLKELQKRFMRNIWNHVNPYTGLAYKDDPVFALGCVANEVDLFLDNSTNRVEYQKPVYYENEFKEMFRQWVEKNGIEYDWDTYHLYNNTPTLCQFKTEITAQYYQEMIEYMRSIGVKIPFTGTNMHPKGYYLTEANKVVDFSDNHLYFYDWRWGNTERICKNRAITSTQTTWQEFGHMINANQPFFSSEWDMTWPNSYRAESSIYLAALIGLQGWCGACIHTYAYTASKLQHMQILGKELSTPVAGVPYREGVFTVWNDPAKFGLFYHAALMTRRGDVSPANKKVAVKPADMGQHSLNAWQGLLEVHRTRTTVDGTLPDGYDELVTDTDNIPLAQPNMLVSDNGQMWRDLNRQIGAVDTPRTKVAYGQLGKGAKESSRNWPTNKPVVLDGMEITCYTDFAVIALSSLSDDPIETSNNMLLSSIGRARNSHMEFDGEKLVDHGQPPIVAEVIEADIRIRTDVKGLKVWGVNAEGFYAGKMRTTYEDGWLSFRIGDENNPACYYLIVKD